MTEKKIGEADLVEKTASLLREAGFPFVQTEARPGGAQPWSSSQVRADVVAWDVTEDGELKPRILVEVKRGLPEDLDSDPHRARTSSVIHQLVALANLFGASEGFVFDGSRWLSVDRTQGRLEKAQTPTPSGNALTNAVPDELFAQHISTEFWRQAESLRGNVQSEALGWKAARSFLERPPSDSERLLEQEGAEPYRQALLRALLKEGVSRFRGPNSWETPWELAAAMARLAAPSAGQIVLDPFCGLGTCLWAAAEQGEDLRLRGLEINQETATLARRLGELGVHDCTITVGDAFEFEPPEKADVLISAPPMGMKLSTRYRLSVGSETANADFVILDRIRQWLAPGGRAVLLVAPGTLFQGGMGERVRRSLQEEFWVVSVVSLPAGLLKPVTGIPLALIVLERRDPKDTLVARLGDDWQQQLAADGDFLRDYRQHLRGTST